MSDLEIHLEKYRMFKTDACNESNSFPIRIEAYFYAAFHLIEAMVANVGIHIEKHQRVRSMLEKNHQIFKDYTEQVWRAFHEIENQIRPGQIYGGAINGKKLLRTIELFQVIETICGEVE
jgi:uncharacterized protein (UPF0332 family)